MGRRRLRNWWSLAAVAVIAAVVAWLLYLLWRYPRRDDLATYGAFALPAAVIVAGWLVWAWRKAKAAGRPAAPSSEEVDRAVDQLGAAVQAQWKKAAEERGLTGTDPIRVTWGRPTLPMAGPARAATGSRRFSPLPGLASAGEAELSSGQAADLHTLYGGLRSGRLIIAGPPGSGKTGAAVLLLLDALRHRDEMSGQDRKHVPVPLLLTAQDWNPDREAVADWVTRKLQDTYLPAAYTRHPGQPPLSYDLATAERALTRIAIQMNDDNTRDLNWWQIPTWVPRTPRVAASAIAFGLAAGLCFGLDSSPALLFGMMGGLLVGPAAGSAAVGGHRPRVIGNPRLAKALSRRILVSGCAVGCGVGWGAGFLVALTVGLTSGLTAVAALVVGALAGSVVGLAIGLVNWLVVGLREALTADPDSYSALNPTSAWHRDRSYGRVVGVVSGLVSGLTVGLIIGLAGAPMFGLVMGLVAGPSVGLVAALRSTEGYAVSLASVQLVIKWRTPRCLMKFLDDGHSRNVLRIVGPSYQFRHAQLQDRLVAAAREPGRPPATRTELSPVTAPAPR